MIEKAYIRFREDLPDSANTFAAAEGFTMLGADIVPFYGFGDLENIRDIGPSVVVCGNLGDIWTVLRVNELPHPKYLDYPEHLKPFFGRDIETMSVGTVKSRTGQCFIKPVQQKLFTGFVWDPLDPRCRLTVAPYADDTPCYVSPIVQIISEWRCFVKHDHIVGCRHYKGDWSVTPDKMSVTDAVVLGKKKMPSAHAPDFGVTACGKTIIIEANDGYALGNYGLTSIVYAQFIEARWHDFFV